ncbi:MAG: hypothetical protein U0V72_13900 [Cytophagales bacterium]
MNIAHSILNSALDLQMDWEYKHGEKLWQRIKNLHPELSTEQAQYTEKLCNDVQKFAKAKSKTCSSTAELTFEIAARFNFIKPELVSSIARQAWFWRI